VSKDNNQKGDVPDNIVRVDFGRARAATEDVAAEKPSPKQAKSVAKAPQNDAGVLSFGDPRAHERLRLFSEWIAGSKVMLVIDATRDDVQVPAQFKNNPETRLDFSLRFGISDFVYDRDSVRCTLSFGGKESYCVIPWAAVLMMYAHETRAVVFFDEDLSEPLDEFDDSEDSETFEDSESSEVSEDLDDEN